MSAETLRRAAALMREQAEAATPGPWAQGEVQDGEVLADGTGYVGDYEPSSEVYALDSEGLCLMEFSAGRRQDAEHIASWHPAVALAVANLLDNEANAMDPAYPNPVPYNDARRRLLLVVARAYLGEEVTA